MSVHEVIFWKTNEESYLPVYTEKTMKFLSWFLPIAIITSNQRGDFHKSPFIQDLTYFFINVSMRSV